MAVAYLRSVLLVFCIFIGLCRDLLSLYFPTGWAAYFSIS